MTNKIIIHFSENGFRSGGVYWFQPDIAIRIIERANETRTPILGLRAAILRPGGMQESLEHSWNYVLALPPIKNAHDHAIQFISTHRNSALRFEVILPELIGSGLLRSQDRDESPTKVIPWNFGKRIST